MKPKPSARRSLKLLARQAWVQSAIAFVISAYLGLTLATMRWRFENRAAADAAVAAPEGIVGCFWHGRIALAVVCRRVLRKKPRRVLISASPDGELIAKVVERLGFPAIRGSSTQDNRRNRRSIGAFRDAIRFLEDGGVVAVTPDGPRGPPEEMASGTVMLARTGETPVFLFGLAARPVLTLKSWDKTQIPLPFGRGCVVFDGPLTIARGAAADDMEAARQEWQTRLSAAQSRAEALLAG